jgi:hypothetical protein
MDQVREAILSSDLGARLADSSNFLQQILRISDRTDASGGVRATRVTADPGASEQSQLDAASAAQPSLATAILSGPELQVVVDRASPGPANLEDGLDDRLFRLQVGYDQPLSSDPQRLMGIERWETKDALLPLWERDGLGVEPGLAPPDFDTLALSGDFSAGFDLLAQPANVALILLAAGDDYILSIGDDFKAGGWLTIDARSLGAGNHVMFDGSAETDGRFSFQGGAGNDFFFGGAGADVIRADGGGDVLSGGGGGDIFAYTAVADSTGADYDLLADFDPAADRIDLPGSVSGFAAAVTSGSVSDASFDHDLGAALGGLGARQAVWFAPDVGDLAGQIFLVVDGNGVAGYQAGEDFVFGIAGSPLADLTGHTGFFV